MLLGNLQRNILVEINLFDKVEEVFNIKIILIMSLTINNNILK
jgi:hypothetical protein